MSHGHDTHHDHHHEDHSVNIKVGLFFLAVLAAITVIGLIN